MVNTDPGYRTPQQIEREGIRDYEKRRQWTRTDSERWLDDRNEALGSLLKTLNCKHITPRVRNFAHLTRHHLPDLFERAHSTLAQLDDADRELTPIEKIVR